MCDLNRKWEEWKSWILVYSAEHCMVWHVLYLEMRPAKRYRCSSDIFCFSIFVMKLCRAEMTGADAYAYFCFSCSSDMKMWRSWKILWFVLFFKYCVVDFHILDAWAALVMFLSFHIRTWYGFYSVRDPEAALYLCNVSSGGRRQIKWLWLLPFKMSIFFFYLSLFLMIVCMWLEIQNNGNQSG